MESISRHASPTKLLQAKSSVKTMLVSFVDAKEIDHSELVPPGQFCFNVKGVVRTGFAPPGRTAN